MNTVFLRYGELYLKSDAVKRHFITTLKKNLKFAFKMNKLKTVVRKEQGQFRVETSNSEKTAEVAGKIFGISKIIIPFQTEADIDKIKKEALKLMKTKKQTFAVRAKRLDKSFRPDSQEINKEIGAYICKHGYKVDLTNPGTIISIEIRAGKAYIYSSHIAGAGGLPLGVSGSFGARLKTKKDCVACWMMMKRGFSLCPLEKTLKYVKALEPWHIGRPFSENYEIKIESENNIDKIIKKDADLFFPLTGFGQKEINDLWGFITS